MNPKILLDLLLGLIDNLIRWVRTHVSGRAGAYANLGVILIEGLQEARQEVQTALAAHSEGGAAVTPVEAAAITRKIAARMNTIADACEKLEP